MAFRIRSAHMREYVNPHYVNPILCIQYIYIQYSIQFMRRARNVFDSFGLHIFICNSELSRLINKHFYSKQLKHLFFINRLSFD